VALRGRGHHYSWARGVVEWSLEHAYRGSWPARLVRATGMQRRVRVRHHRIATPRWPAGVRPLRIAFASDLHAGPTTHPEVLDEAFARLAHLAADVVLLGGDYVFLSADHIPAIAERVARLRPPLGMFAVLGNHDLWADDQVIAGALEHAGARVLVNERVTLPAPFDAVALAGLDDPWTGERPAMPVFRDDDQVRVVVMHAPEGFVFLEHQPFELAVCGHTHGGHIALPSGVPILVPGPLSRRFAHGRHDVGHGRALIVSRGVGSTEVALRLNADPDVLLIEVGGVR
jgi:predicted MPP superfamily phosphohydrolase